MNKINLPVSFTIFTSTSGPLSKTYTLENKRIEKTPAAQMYRGTADRGSMPFKDFGLALSEASSEQAFGYGLHSEKYAEEVDIVVSGKERPKDNILSRTKKFFSYRRRPGILMLDHDPSEYGSILTADELIEILITIDPEIAKAARIIRGSVSAGVHLAGKKPKKGKGFHIYIPVKDASVIPRYGKLLFDRLWLKGHGYIALASNGALLVRSLIDDAVFSGERLDFVGEPIILSEGIQYTEPLAKYVPGRYLDTSKLPELDDKEARRVKVLIANAKKDIKPDSVLKKAECKNHKIEKIIQKSGISRKEATELVAKIFTGKCKKLWGDWILEFPEGDVTVVMVFEDPDAYDGKALADPIEGRTYGKTTAKFWWNDGKPIIHSFAHGQDVSYSLSIKEPKRYIEGVDSYYDHPDYISKEEACEQMELKVEQWLKNPTGNRAIAAPAGIGKTKIILEHIATVAKNKFIEIYVPTHQLANEVRKTLLEFKPKLKVTVIRGRTFIDKNTGAVALCKKSDLIGSIQNYDYNIYKDVCKGCNGCKVRVF